METVQTILQYAQAHSVWWGVLLLTLSAAVEYLFPPFPGDSVTIVGAILIPTAGWPFWAVFAAVMVGSMAGAAVDWWVGTWLAREHGRQTFLHRFVQRENVASRLDKIKQQFDRHGSVYIAANRFVPAFRALFFVAAGMARLDLRRVMLFTGLSAAAWNGALLAVGYLVGYNLDALVDIVSKYTTAVLISLGVLLAIRLLWGRLRDG